jgi:RimJ/RimL family protein N-acetyltransferase
VTTDLRISTERLRLRPIAPEDFPYWLDFFATEHSQYVGGPLSEEEAWYRIAGLIGHWAMNGYGHWSVETPDGEYLGRTGLDQPAGWDEPELGWSFMAAAGGKGYATEAAKSVLVHERARLGKTGVVSYIKTDNAPFISLAERMGAFHDKATIAPWPDYLVYRHPEAQA